MITEALVAEATLRADADEPVNTFDVQSAAKRFGRLYAAIGIELQGARLVRIHRVGTFLL